MFGRGKSLVVVAQHRGEIYYSPTILGNHKGDVYYSPTMLGNHKGLPLHVR